MLKKILEQFRRHGASGTVKNTIYHYLTRERKVRFGDLNKDKTFYIIRSINHKSRFYVGPVNNLFANYFYVISHLQYAKNNGWIPVVDQLNYPVYNSVSCSINGSNNAWEYFWKQPSDYTLEEVYNSYNVVLSKQNWFSEYDMGYEKNNYLDKDIITFYANLSEKIQLNEEVKKILTIKCESFFPDNGKILGVNYRFGGHSLNHYDAAYGHPIQPDIKLLTELVLNVMQDKGFKYVFLASDTTEGIEYFKNILQDKLLYVKRNRLSEQFDRSSTKQYLKNMDLYTHTLEYIYEMEILSRCNGLIGSINSGFRYAIIKNNNKFEYLNVLDYGLIK